MILLQTNRHRLDGATAAAQAEVVETLVSTVFDLVVERNTEGYYNRHTPLDSRLSVSALAGNPDLSALPAIGRTAPGFSVVYLARPGRRIRKVLDFRTVVQSSSSRLTGFVEGTPSGMSQLLLAQIFADPQVDRNIFNMNAYGSGLDWNTGCCCNGYDFSGIPVKHMNSGFSGGGVAITRRHVYVTHHLTGHANQTSFTFLGSDGQEVTLAVIGQSESDNPGNGNTDSNWCKPDTHVYTLESDLPATVAVYPIPASHATSWDPWRTWVNSYHHLGSCLPLLAVSGSRKVSVTYGHHTAEIDLLGWLGLAFSGSIHGTNIIVRSANALGTAAWTGVTDPLFPAHALADLLAGDSGCPVFYPLADGGLVLAGLYSGIVNNVGVAQYLSKPRLDLCIASADDDAGFATGYTVMTADDPTG